MDTATQTVPAHRRTSQLAALLAGLCGDSSHASPLPATHPQPAQVTADNGSTVTGSKAPEAAMTVGEMLDRTHHAGFGFIAALLALMSIPLVGLTIPFGLAVAGLGIQMIAGLPRPWLPEFIRRRRVTKTTLEWLSVRTTRWTTRMTHFVRPRLPWLTTGPFWVLCGAGLVIQGLSLTLPVPGADWLFVVPIVLYGIGLLERDGLLILACHTLTLIQIVLAVVLWELIARGFADAYRWCMSALG